MPDLALKETASPPSDPFLRPFRQLCGAVPPDVEPLARACLGLAEAIVREMEPSGRRHALLGAFFTVMEMGVRAKLAEQEVG